MPGPQKKSPIDLKCLNADAENYSSFSRALTRLMQQCATGLLDLYIKLHVPNLKKQENKNYIRRDKGEIVVATTSDFLNIFKMRMLYKKENGLKTIKSMVAVYYFTYILSGNFFLSQ